MKRFDLLPNYYGDDRLEEDPDGEWVRYSDHVEAMKRIAGEGADAAAFIERKAEEYARDFGYSDMGCLSFGSGDHAQVKMDHYTSLTELAEEIRALAVRHGAIEIDRQGLVDILRARRVAMSATPPAADKE